MGKNEGDAMVLETEWRQTPVFDGPHGDDKNWNFDSRLQQRRAISALANTEQGPTKKILLFNDADGGGEDANTAASGLSGQPPALPNPSTKLPDNHMPIVQPPNPPNVIKARSLSGWLPSLAAICVVVMAMIVPLAIVLDSKKSPAPIVEAEVVGASAETLQKGGDLSEIQVLPTDVPSLLNGEVDADALRIHFHQLAGLVEIGTAKISSTDSFLANVVVPAHSISHDLAQKPANVAFVHQCESILAQADANAGISTRIQSKLVSIENFINLRLTTVKETMSEDRKHKKRDRKSDEQRSGYMAKNPEELDIEQEALQFAKFRVLSAAEPLLAVIDAWLSLASRRDLREGLLGDDGKVGKDH
ncbi:uncharacterized protein KY384_004669 [Bacidia gigantensis]|uniref:uncharacterized protein n=1 Tax=Bacidia gigantensis TaxID=2732470 RepID=UPI001D052104|nr:uncharacterized protein KY384_004669 [Bacidia gigantensis]KAG8530631.1 hypothetical protein KY384_004669 [Bacidia gigantensis]